MDKNLVLLEVRLVDICVELLDDSREKKDFITSDKIRGELKKLGVVVKNRKGEKSTWEYAKTDWNEV